MNKLLRQGFSFVLISGLGWLIDFGLYLYLSGKLAFPVVYANMLSAVPAVTFVFFTATKKTFSQKTSSSSLQYKYLIYFGYQLLLLAGVSLLGQAIYAGVMKHSLLMPVFIFNNVKLIVKLMITPITMLFNFIVMKTLIEKL